MKNMRYLSFFYNYAYLPWIIAILGVGLSTLTAWNTSKGMEQMIHERFVSASDQTVLLIQESLQNNIQLLKSASVLFARPHGIESKEWETFSNYHQLQKNFRGLQGFAYAPLVSTAKRHEYEKRIREESYPKYTIFPSSTFEKSFPITYIEPLSEINKKALGFDLYSQSTRRIAIDEAIQRGDITFSSKIELVQESIEDEKMGFLILLPIYTQNTILDSIVQREENIEGILTAGIKVKELLAPVIHAKLGILDFEIYDGKDPSQETKIFDSNTRLNDPILERYIVLDMYGKKWTLYFKSNEALQLDINHNLSLRQWVFGVSLSLLLAGIIYLLLRARKNALFIITENSKKIARSEEKVRSLFQTMQEGIVVIDYKGIIQECNAMAAEMFGVSAEAMIGQTNSFILKNAIHENGKSLSAHEKPFAKAYVSKEVQNNIILGMRHDEGSVTWLKANVKPMLNAEGEVYSVIVTLSDITELSHSKYTLERYVKIIDKHVIISSTDCMGIITEVSSAFCSISGYSKKELLGKNHNIVRYKDFPASVYEQMWKRLKEEKGTWEGEIQNQRKDGSTYWVHTIIEPRYDRLNTLIGYTSIRQDITDKKRVEELSITDRLTGLYNRLKLDELFAFHLSVAKRHQGAFSIIILDIDKFKLVNDTYGHQTGDSVLKEMAAILKKSSRLEDALGRWGGEEFLILLPSSGLDASMALAEKLRNVIAKHTFEGVGSCTASFGVATFRTGDNEHSLVSRADLALYKAKENGRNKVEAESS